jgi:hypothetical protein
MSCRKSITVLDQVSAPQKMKTTLNPPGNRRTRSDRRRAHTIWVKRQQTDSGRRVDAALRSFGRHRMVSGQRTNTPTSTASGR